MGIEVTADGHVHIGNNEWVSLEAIQQAVLQKQNPALNVNCPHCQSDDLYDYSKPTKKVVNVDQEPLELPTTLRVNEDDRKQKPVTNDDEEFLPLPSSAR
jgi:hypothetical protein